MIITAGRHREQICWSELWARFSARTDLAAGLMAIKAYIEADPGFVARIRRQ
jgi:hypothetical protein